MSHLEEEGDAPQQFVSEGVGDREFVRASVEDSFSLKAFLQNEQHELQISRGRLAAVGITGAVFGMILSIAVNSVLFEISVSRVFAFYFGMIFCLLGSLILIRSWTQPTMWKKLSVLCFSVVVIGAGACSFTFRTSWLWWNSGSKVFIYTLLGVATSFTVTFCWVDLLSLCHDLAKRREGLSGSTKFGLIESPIQVWLVLAVSVIAGVTYGLIFGLVQLEELKYHHHSRTRLMTSLGKIELFSLPFGAILGAAAALLNEIIRHRTMVAALQREVEYKPLSQNEIDGI